MKTILIADRDPAAAAEIARVAEHAYPGAETVRADNEASLLQLAFTRQFDLIIYDAPRFGFDAIRTIQYHDRPAFILTAEPQEMDFILDAYYLGITFFLPRPIQAEELTDVIRHAEVTYVPARIADKYSRAEYTQSVVQTMATGFVCLILFAGLEHSTPEVEDYLDYMRHMEHYILIADTGLGEESAEATAQVRAAFQNRFKGVIFHISRSRMIVFVTTPHRENHEQKVKSIEACRELVRQLEPIAPGLCIGIGRKYSSVHNMRLSTIQAGNALYHGVHSGRPVAHIDDVDTGAEGPQSNEMHLGYLLRCIKRGECTAATIFLTGLADDFGTVDRLKTFMLGLTLRVNRKWPESEIFCLDVVEQLSGAQSREACLGIYEDFLSRITAQINLAEEKEQIEGKIDAFILRNLDRDIKLEQAAAEIGLSPSYFSKRCRELTGKTFSQKVTSLRMAKAKELLAKGNLPVREIAALVGYKDACYFSKTFKRYTGHVPSAFR